MSLLPQHQKLIDNSVISSTVAAARGYRSVEKKSELRELGFGESQRRTPALLIPIHNVTGEIGNYLLRPDALRIKDGRPLKYELPKDSEMVLDVPAAAREDIDDPRVPLFITEGSRKADAAVGIGLCCISLIGVWCWRGTNEKGGKVALAEFDSIALSDRDVYIAFDSDVMTKASVHGALRRLSEFLKARGAKVRFIYLPPGEKGEKVGLDDFLASGAERAELLSLARAELRQLEVEDRDDLYLETESGIFWRNPNRDRELTELANFTARIIADIVEDDGAERRRLLEITAKFNGRTSTFQVPAAQFESLDWAIEQVGAGAAIAPGTQLRQQARHAIQILSGDPPRRERFAHLGWREIDGRQVYLSAGAAICAGGALKSVEVVLTAALADFALPEPPVGDALRRAVKASLQLCNLAPDEIGMPLLAAVYRAPLGPSDFSLFLAGPTGVFKTATAAVCQAHWGADLDERNLPESFRSTPNAIEGLLFQAKDCLAVVDEFSPGGSRGEIDRAHRDADRVLRSQGNRAGRGRMTRDARLRPAKRPRGLTLVTGEDLPSGQSLRARLLALELTTESINSAILTELQAAGRESLLSAAMAGYIRHTAARREKGDFDLRAERERIHAELEEVGHRRTSGVLADLLVGMDHLIEFSTACDALTPAEGEALRQRSFAAIVKAAERQSDHQTDAEPTERFRTLLRSALSSGAAHLANPQGGEPENPTACGWRREGEDLRPKGRRVGWESDGQIYLDLNAALAAVADVERGAAPIAVGAQTLRKRLHERGHLQSTEKRGRETLTVRRKLEGSRRSVLHLSPAFLGIETAGIESEGSVGPDEEEPLTKEPTTPPSLFEEPAEGPGQVGQVTTESTSNSAGAYNNEGGVSPSSPLPQADPPDQSDQDEGQADELDVEVTRLLEKFPDLDEIDR